MPLSAAPPSICLSCRLRLLARLYAGNSTIRPLSSFVLSQSPFGHSSTPSNRLLLGSPCRSKHFRAIHSGRPFGEQYDHAKAVATEVPPEELDVVPANGHNTMTLPGGTPEEIARQARQTYGDRLPPGLLNEKEYKMYERLYGTPLPESLEDEVGEVAGDILLREGSDGELEEVEYLEEEHGLPEEQEEEILDVVEQQNRDDADVHRRRSKADTRLEDDIQATIGASLGALTVRSPDEVAPYEEEERDSNDVESEGNSQDIRTHPFTLAGRFGTNPSTLPLPQDGMIMPVSLLINDLSNKHLDESAARIFGGASLPYGTGTPASSRTIPQKPIPLSASQARMTEMEADLYMSVVLPGTYAAVMSVLVETRKRLGSEWIEGLMKKEGGPRILDAGAGGAGVMAWREILKAEWSRLNPQQGQEDTVVDASKVPFGKATVLTASNQLRQRASILLENTTFIPRLPDYVHTHFDADADRKQFDIIVAPHGLWHLQEDFERRQRVLNLWSLLEPKQGVLILLEKGVPRGFEVVADARSYLLRELFESSMFLDEDQPSPPSSSETGSPPPSETPDDDNTSTASKSQSLRDSRRAPGRIIAPCTNHAKCPMYLIPGISRQRKDYCHFSQRYVRPPYMQRMLGAKDRNHEDVRFSYIAVQKGTAYNDDSIASGGRGVFLGDRATERAFMGYEAGDEDISPSTTSSPFPTATATQKPQTQSQPQLPSHFPHPTPRLILPPLKRHGHIILDVCTPSGTLERWTVTKSPSRQAYRDARKSKWGDLWKLGAKFRVERRVRLGWGHMEQGIGTGRGEMSIKGSMENGGKGGKGKGVRDVVGRRKDAEDGVEGGGKAKQPRTAESRGLKRKEEKERGRAKARRRKREAKESMNSRYART